MPQYRISYELVDANGRNGRKTFETVATMLDEPAALAAAAALATDLSNLTLMRILAYTVSQRIVYTDTVDPSANKDEGLTLTLRKADNYLDSIKVPAPIMTIFDGQGNADLTDAAVSAFVSNFLSGGDFTFSDGEQATESVRGTLDT